MKKIVGLLFGAASLVGCSIAKADTAANMPLNVGIEYHVKSTEASSAEWANLAHAIGATTHQKVHLKEYANHQKLINDLSSGKLALGYLKILTSKQVRSQHSDIKLLATAVTKDPLTGKDSTTYNSQILVASTSSMNNLSGLQNKTMAYYSPRSVSNYIAVKKKLNADHIAVTWRKFSTPKAAFNAVLRHHADAIGAWDYVISHDANKAKFKMIAALSGHKNPGIYANTNLISQAVRQQLKTALAHVKGPYNIVGFN